MIQHHAAGQQHGSGIGNVPVRNTLPCVPCGLRCRKNQERDKTLSQQVVDRHESRIFLSSKNRGDTDRFKDSVGMAIISPRDKARPSHQACTHVAHHVSIQIGHHHHVELLGLGHQLKTQTNRVAGESCVIFLFKLKAYVI